MGSLRTRTVDAMGRQKREGWLQHCPPFVRPGSLQSPTFCWMLFDPSVFYRIWFWPSADAENTKPDHDEKSLHRHTIPYFASSKSPFGLQLGSQETPHAYNKQYYVNLLEDKNLLLLVSVLLLDGGGSTFEIYQVINLPIPYPRVK